MTPRRLAFLVAVLAVGATAPAAFAQSAPTLPERLTPLGGDRVSDGPVRFTWRDSVDPQSLPVRYEIEVTEVVANGKSARRVAQVTAANGDVGVAIEGLPWGPLSWRIRAVDSAGAASPWTEPPSVFTVLAPAAPTSPSTRDDGNAPGCDVAGRHSARTDGALLCFALALLLVAVRRPR